MTAPEPLCDLKMIKADYRLVSHKGKRPANHASHFAIIYENVCPLTGKLMGTHDDGYCSGWS
jgi:hypothetical protein